MAKGPVIDFAGLAAVVKGSRERSGKNLREIAKECDVSASTLSRIERGAATTPDLETVKRIVAWAGVPIDQVIRDDSERHLEARLERAKARGDTLGMMEIQFRADPKLRPEAAEALLNIMRAAYTTMALHEPTTTKSKK